MGQKWSSGLSADSSKTDAMCTAMKKYPVLPRSFKNCFPFRIGTTSFIYPDNYLPNVRMLAPCMDEIEILMFESSGPGSLPSPELISGLQKAGEEYSLTYNVHLPTDVSLTDSDSQKRKNAVESIRLFAEKTRPLSPSAFALHLDWTADDSLLHWQKRSALSLAALRDAGIPGPLLAVETLDYPIEYADPLIQEFDLSLCMDMGHLFLYGLDAKKIWEKYARRIPLIHLHGVRGNKDHLGLDCLKKRDADTASAILREYQGVVSIEVFSYPHLLSSLDFFENRIVMNR
jgi:sugar phosphate isomerase/epimerase